jgi:hypothetical protein
MLGTGRDLHHHGRSSSWVDWWEARDAKNNRHHPGFWE